MPRLNLGRFWRASGDDIEYSKVGDGPSDAPDLQQALPYGLRLRKTNPFHALLFIITWLCTAAMLGFGLLYFLGRGDEAAARDFFPRSMMSDRPYTFYPVKSLWGSSLETDAAWDTLMPPGRGYVLISQPHLYDIFRPGIPNDGLPDRFAVSAFHQLHCLGMIRSGYYATMQGKEPLAHGESPHHSKQHDDHVGHCFDYLRQAIQCHGDTTIEFASSERDHQGKPYTVDGWGVEHKYCTDWDALWQWTVEHQAPANFTGIN